MNLGERIKEKRQNLGMTQEELAKAVGVTAQHISGIEQGKRAPSISLLLELANQLGVTIDFIITGKEELMPDTITAIRADKSLKAEVKKALITLITALRTV